MLTMKHKSFENQQLLPLSRTKAYESAREAAVSFMNSIGAEKVVSVAEDSLSATVTVWYREEGDARPSKDVMPEV
jgi:hypothetical protein